MTNSMIPYSFTPGTKAKAQEVNANFIALAEKIDENNKNIVHDNDSSIITGQKTFTKPIYSSGAQSVSNGNLIITNITEDKITDAITVKNNNSVRIGSLRYQNGSGFNESSITAADDKGDICFLGIRNPNGTTNGTAYAFAPIYTANYADVSNKIVTTSYMSNHWTATRATTVSTASKARPAVVIQNYVNDHTWFRVWSDGWIEQGLLALGSNGLIVTLPKAFSNTNYTATGSRFAPSAYEDTCVQIWPVSVNQIILAGKDNSWRSVYLCGY